MPIVSDFTALIGDGDWNGLLPAASGQPIFITYSFSSAPQKYLTGSAFPQAFNNSFVSFNEQQRADARYALGLWESVSGIRFLEAPAGQGTIQFGNFNTSLQPSGPASGFSYMPNPVLNPTYANSSAIEGDVFIDVSIMSGNLKYLMLHEIGHALGLKHPFEGTNILESSLNNRTQTVMSYTGPALVNQTLMPMDIAAIQYLYGTNSNDASHVTSWNWDSISATLSFVGKVGNDRLIGSFSKDIIDGIAGDDYIYGDNGGDIISGGDGADTIFGGEGDDLIFGGSGSDFINGDYGRDTIRGGAGDDNLNGNARIIGGTDAPDTVDYSDAIAKIEIDLQQYLEYTNDRFVYARGSDIGKDVLSEFANVWAGIGNDIVRGDSLANELHGREGADTLNGRAGNDILLGDGAVLPTSGALSIYRLYLATLGRAPDDAGWAEWSGRLAGGQPLNTISSGFVGSQEFLARYGNPDNVGFVNLLYQNVLGRTPDSAGLQNWLGAFNGGMSRNQMVVEFSESAELKANADPSTQAGQIYRIYGATLARVPDNTGFTSWSDLMAGGRSIDSVAAGFVGSTEFQSVYGPLNNTQFVTLLYQNVLSRAPDAMGLAGWKAKLDSGESRTSVVLGFSDSGEYKIAKNTAFVSYMKTVYAGFNDSLDGSTGDDQLSGGLGADTFAFSSSEVGSDIVHRFEAWDTVRLIGFGYATKAVALAKVTQQGADAVFSDKGESITFVNTTLSTLQQADWLFV
jgi:Ca2+-binding RTX toxin-like protein